ncbi:hypothetical protein [Oligoflexus tunisiensis]|uniref:hypothetical protein n=1 Tax=Oligoflexus tunisiensis TaxID=708132 RepID=UPI00114CBA65|nr:hypothetical protein [Oligoflexus tunisiensis]
MKFFNAILFSLISVTSAAQGAEIFPTENLGCTKDLNPWGKPSRCFCPVESRYDARLGSCVIGEYESITVSGQVVTGIVAIGGETTGIALRTFENPDVSYELVVTREDRRILSRLNGLPFEVEGDFIELPGLETGARPAIIVKELRWLD